MKNIEPFMHDTFYHVYNRTNNKEALFKDEDNFPFFIHLYRRYLEPFVHTYSYALLTNHFHFSISVKSVEEISEVLSRIKVAYYTVPMSKYRFKENKSEFIHDLISGQFRRFFISYAKSINKHYNRKGSLFQKRFKNPILNTAEKFTWNQYYIHHNARKHGLIDNFLDYPHTSYYQILNDTETFLARDYLFNWFGDKKSYENFHLQTLEF
jgi:hypothetical protein